MFFFFCQYLFDSIVVIVDVDDARQKPERLRPCLAMPLPRLVVGTACATGGFCAPLQQQLQTVRGQG